MFDQDNIIITWQMEGNYFSLIILKIKRRKTCIVSYKISKQNRIIIKVYILSAASLCLLSQNKIDNS